VRRHRILVFARVVRENRRLRVIPEVAGHRRLCVIRDRVDRVNGQVVKHRHPRLVRNHDYRTIR
jgi:hypothetical protein